MGRRAPSGCARRKSRVPILLVNVDQRSGPRSSGRFSFSKKRSREATPREADSVARALFDMSKSPIDAALDRAGDSSYYYAHERRTTDDIAAPLPPTCGTKIDPSPIGSRVDESERASLAKKSDAITRTGFPTRPRPTPRANAGQEHPAHGLPPRQSHVRARPRTPAGVLLRGRRRVRLRHRHVPAPARRRHARGAPPPRALRRRPRPRHARSDQQEDTDARGDRVYVTSVKETAEPRCGDRPRGGARP